MYLSELASQLNGLLSDQTNLAMSELSPTNQDRINHVLKHNHLVQKINVMLEENGLHDFCVKTLRLQLNSEAETQLPRDCQRGYELQWICNDGNSCEMRCVPAG